MPNPSEICRKEVTINMLDRIKYVIIPVCKALAKDAEIPALYSPSAVLLLGCTVATESFGGRLVHQISGPAVSEYQMEWIRYIDIIRWLDQGKQNLKLMNAVTAFRASRSAMQDFDQLHGNFAYATALARIGYYMKSDALPAPTDLEGMWRYYKKHWNTEAGAATREKFMADVAQYMPSLKELEDLWV